MSWFSSLYTFALETILLVQIKPSCNAHPPFAMVEPSYFGNQHVSRPEGDPQFLTAVSSASANSWQQQADRVSRDLLDRQPNQPTFNHPTLLDTPKMYQNVNMSLGPGENPFFRGGEPFFWWLLFLTYKRFIILFIPLIIFALGGRPQSLGTSEFCLIRWAFI